MIMDRLGVRNREGDLNVGKFRLERVREFRYLNTTINDKNEIRFVIFKRHLDIACFYTVNKLLKMKLLS